MQNFVGTCFSQKQCGSRMDQYCGHLARLPPPSVAKITFWRAFVSQNVTHTTHPQFRQQPQLRPPLRQPRQRQPLRLRQPQQVTKSFPLSHLLPPPFCCKISPFGAHLSHSPRYPDHAYQCGTYLQRKHVLRVRLVNAVALILAVPCVLLHSLATAQVIRGVAEDLSG